jgi:NDP-sugar pyrophosphorylase family protein
VPALAQFGNLAFDGGELVGFAEKRSKDNSWIKDNSSINGGFMVMEHSVFEHLSGNRDVREVDLLERLTHTLERLRLTGAPPWKRW